MGRTAHALSAGLLRVGYLRSHDTAVGAAIVDLIGAPPHTPPCVLNGTWDLPISIFSSTDCTFKLSKPPCVVLGNGSRRSNVVAPKMHQLRFQVLASAAPGRFTLYTLSAW
jgi:hypothetical protein